MSYPFAARPIAALLILATFALHPALAQKSDRFAIVGVDVIPMDTERVLEDQVIIVENGVIQSIGDAGSTTLTTGLSQIDGSGRFLMPGLADLHVHIRNADELVNYVAWGVTTVMHLGGSGESGTRQLQYRDEIRSGTRLGPNIYTTDRILDGDPAIATGAHSVGSEDEARRIVRDLRANGFDFVKIYNNVSQPVFDAIVDEARRQRLPVIGHIPRNFDSLTALSSGQDAVAHTEELFFTYFGGPRSTENMDRDYVPDLARLPALVKVLKDNNVALMPDLSFTFGNLLMWDSLDHLWGDPEYPFLHPNTASMWRAGNINRRSNIENFILRGQWKYNLLQRLTREFQEAGILQVIGTDASLAGLFPGKAAHRELTEFVKAGLSNFEALSIGSRNAGEFVRQYIDDDVRFGQVLPGYRADLVLLDANPLEDIRNATTVSGVVVNGSYYDESLLEQRRAKLRNRYSVLSALNEEVDAALESRETYARIANLVAAHEGDPEAQDSIESRVNAAGYAAGFGGDLDRAESLLELNTRLFPNSANAWDSFGEITLYLGDAERAIALYEKALEINPGFANAAEQIEAIRSQADK
jgi:cytosine/adenosine deaminase-related metal-dependent hydrolase